MSKRTLLISSSVAFVALLGATGVLFWPQIISLKQQMVGDEKVDCTALPVATVARNREGDLRSFAVEVTMVTNGVGFADFDFQRCPGRVELFVGYGSEKDKPKLVELWRQSAVRDIPVHWRNV